MTDMLKIAKAIKYIYNAYGTAPFEEHPQKLINNLKAALEDVEETETITTNPYFEELTDYEDVDKTTTKHIEVVKTETTSNNNYFAQD